MVKVVWIFVIVTLFVLSAQAEPVHSLRVPLPGQDDNLIKESWPGIGCWFWSAAEFEPEGYKSFIDLHAEYSSFELLTTSIRHPVEVTDPAVHDQIKAAAIYAQEKGMKLVMDLDVRLARQAFMDAYPEELQEIVRLREVPLQSEGEVSFAIESMNLGDHYTFKARGYDCVSSRLLRVYAYENEGDAIRAGSIEDITDRCKVNQADTKGVQVSIPCDAKDTGRSAMVLAAFTLFTPAVYAPQLPGFERAILEQYSDIPLAGACKDEWGFPGRFNPRSDDLWYSRYMAEAYTARCPGRDLTEDLLLMVKGEAGKEGERIAAINHYMEMNSQKNAALETAYYHAIKDIFGEQAMSATHPTWYPFPSKHEVFKDGLHWWASQRDLAQTDEATPFAARTALAKKWHSPLWFNMYYDKTIESYESDLWRHVLGGGRMNFHPQYPRKDIPRNLSLLQGDILRASCRVELLNYLAAAPVDCPVAVVFGHPSVMNFAGDSLGVVGLAITDALWEQGYYADLIPSSEITNGSLTISEDSAVQYGPQRYAAVVFYHPQYDRAGTAAFFQQAAQTAATALFRVGDWTVDFDGQPIDSAAALPENMKALEGEACVQAVIAHLQAIGSPPQTPGEMYNVAGFPKSVMPLPKGHCRLLDGTVIYAAGENNVMGDPIREEIDISGHPVTIDAVGLAAVRLDDQGNLHALAAGALKNFQGGGLTLDLDTPLDLALWRDTAGKWQGVVQGYEGELPKALTDITQDWVRKRIPKRYEGAF